MSDMITQVIIVDDEKNIRTICQRALNKINIFADTAETAEEGLKKIREKSYKVVLLDIMLPQMDGMQLLKIIRKQFPETEVIMLTGNATVEDAVQAMKEGAYDFITKPFEVHEIRKAVKKAIQKKQLEREVGKLRELVSIYEVSSALGRIMPIKELLKLIFRKAKKAVKASGGSIFIYDEMKKKLIVEYTEGLCRVVGETIELGKQNCGYAAATGEPALVNCVINDGCKFKNLKILNGEKSEMCIPMTANDKLVGVINFIREQGRFSDYDFQIAAIFAQQAALSVQNAKDFEELKKLDQLKSDFLANISHELKTPLQSIINSIELINKDINPKMLKVLLRNAMRMKELVTQLLEFSKIEKSGLELNFTEVNINQVINEAVEEVCHTASLCNIKLKVFSETALKPVRADRNAVKRTILNLLDNAIKFSPKGSTVKVAANAAGKGVIVSVEDYGKGIPEGEEKKIFQRFYQQQPDYTLTKKTRGIGLGLSLVKEIIEAHGSQIEVNSTPGKGSVFSFLLPFYNE